MTRYLKANVEGGVSALCTTQYYRPVSEPLPHRDALKTHFQAHPPHTVAEASHTIAKLTGIKLALSACRDFMCKRLGMKCRKMAAMPAKAYPEQQLTFLHGTLELLLEEEKQSQRRGFFVDGAHCVHCCLKQN